MCPNFEVRRQSRALRPSYEQIPPAGKVCIICRGRISPGESCYRMCGDVLCCRCCAEELSLYGFLARCREEGADRVLNALKLTEETGGL